MADVWDAYVKKFGKTPKDSTQLQQFAKSAPNIKPLSFKEARDVFNKHKTKPVVTNGAKKKPSMKVNPKQLPTTTKPKTNKPLPAAKKYNIHPKPNNITKPKPNNTIHNSNKQEIKRQMDECKGEVNNLNALQTDFGQNYNAQIKDIENQFKNIYDALKRREMDLKKWRKQEFDEGMNSIKSTKSILNKRINDLNAINASNINNIYNIPKLNDFHIARFTKHSLQIQNTINNIFQIGQTYQQNINNKQFISLKINKNPANNINNMRQRNNNMMKKDKLALDFSSSPFGKGKIIQTSPVNNKPKKKVIQKNGTKSLQYKNNASGIRGFDIGNNAKYASAHQTAQNTNTLPSNFWEEESDSDSEQERQETQDEIVQRWQTQSSNIRTTNKPKYNNNNRSNNKKKNNNKHIPIKKPIRHERVRSMYDASSSDDDEDNDEDDGFEKYVPPPQKKKIIDPIAEAERKKKEEENMWKNNNTKWIIYEENKQFEYDSKWFKVPKMRNGKANGMQMKTFMQKSGLSKDILKKVWRLSDLDKDGKMGNEEFSLCLYLMDKAKKGQKLPDKLPKNYIPPSFRGKRLVKTPPKKARPLPKSQAIPPKMDLAKTMQNNSKPVSRSPKPNGSNDKKAYKVKAKQTPTKQNNSNNKNFPKIKPKQVRTKEKGNKNENKEEKKEESREQVKKTSEMNKENNAPHTTKSEIKKNGKKPSIKSVKRDEESVVNKTDDKPPDKKTEDKIDDKVVEKNEDKTDDKKGKSDKVVSVDESK